MLNKNNGLHVSLLRIHIKSYLCKIGGILLMLSAINAIATPNLPELPDELVLAIRAAIQAHPDVMIANSQMLSAKSQVEAGG